MATSQNNSDKKQGWNLVCDKDTHEALDILGAYMMGKEKMPVELKRSVKVPKSKVIKILAYEKLKSLNLIKTTSEVYDH